MQVRYTGPEETSLLSHNGGQAEAFWHNFVENLPEIDGIKTAGKEE